MLSVKIKRDPYEVRKYLYKNSTIELQAGMNVIIGRNGSGKTTFCQQLEKYCNSSGIPVFRYDNYTSGGDKAVSEYLFHGFIEDIAMTAFHSEGEQIYYNLGKQIGNIGKFVAKHPTEKQLVVILDAIDSGLDIYGLDNLVNIVKTITDDCASRGTDIYFAITANNYGIIHKNQCIDINTGNSIYFDNFEDYHSFIAEQYKRERIKYQRKQKKTLY